MQEKLLQFIWRYSLYNPVALTTTQHEPVTIIHPGIFNTNAGPDFLEARVKVGDTILAGHIEMHINTSDWLKHGHQHDKAYNNVVLHVVFNNDTAEEGTGNNINIPLLTLENHIPKHVIDRYASLTGVNDKLPCVNELPTLKEITKEAWLSRLLAERWEEKSLQWQELLIKSANDWRNVLYWRMAANFGFKVNAMPFLLLAQSLPLNVLAKHGDNLEQIEALLFGQAGMLQWDFKDEYPLKLKQEYAYLQNKYKLIPIAGHLWKFLRLRPANFPTIRIAQFAALVKRSMHLFSQIIERHSIKEILPLLDVEASEYWQEHYRFDEPAEKKSSRKLGKSSIENIVINAIAPIQFLYAAHVDDSNRQEKSLQLLDSVPAEKNYITSYMVSNNWTSVNAGQSQALLQLHNSYCQHKRCLDCAVGLAILKSGPDK